jgi:hypothetical protein
VWPNQNEFPVPWLATACGADAATAGPGFEKQKASGAARPSATVSPRVHRATARPFAMACLWVWVFVARRSCIYLLGYVPNRIWPAQRTKVGPTGVQHIQISALYLELEVCCGFSVVPSLYPLHEAHSHQPAASRAARGRRPPVLTNPRSTARSLSRSRARALFPSTVPALPFGLQIPICRYRLPITVSRGGSI